MDTIRLNCFTKAVKIGFEDETLLLMIGTNVSVRESGPDPIYLA
jgi:hypothetical protein